MKKLLYFIVSLVVAGLAACGGGSTGNPSATATSVFKATAVMWDGSGTEVTNRLIPPDTNRIIHVKVTDSKGADVNNALVKLTIEQDATYVVVSGDASGLTVAGAINFYVAMGSERKNGVANLKISVDRDGTTASTSFVVQTTGGTGVATGNLAMALALALVDQNGVEITSRSISQTKSQSLRVLVKDAANQPQPFSYVTLTFTKGSDLVNVVNSNGSKLTDSNGLALFTLEPKSVASNGAIEATVKAESGAANVTGTLTMQTEIGNVVLGAVKVNPTALLKGASTVVSVPVTLNGVTAPSNSVSVDFSSTCGTVTPASALVGASGQATAVIKTENSGPSCKVTASASGATAVVGTFAVTDAPVSSLLFIKASPEMIYQKNSPGTSTSQITFRLLDTLNNLVPGRAINATLSNTDSGVVFCDSTAQSSSTSRQITNSSGEVTFSVCAGTLPTTVVVKASMETVTGESAVETSSNILTVQTGLPSQRFFDISTTALNINAGAGKVTEEGVERGTPYYLPWKTTTLNVFLADRLGNPVPEGTSVVFVTEGGQINGASKGSCKVAGGGCSVSLIGQEHRPWGSGEANADPRPGRVTVLAMADGEESFVDSNRNNRYDAGESFDDLGLPFLDLDENGTFSANSILQLVQGGFTQEQTFPLSASAQGSLACPSSSTFIDTGLSVAGTCNGKWDGLTTIRRKITVVFSGGEIGIPSGDGTSCVDGVADGPFNSKIPCAKRTRMVTTSASEMTARISDGNGNPMPFDAALSYSVIPQKTGCTITPTVVGNYGSTTEPILMKASVTGCSGSKVQFTVTADGRVSSFLSPAIP